MLNFPQFLPFIGKEYLLRMMDQNFIGNDFSKSTANIIFPAMKTQNKRETLPEAQRTQGIESIT